MTDLKDTIRQKRPNLSQSSIITYNSILKNLFKNVFGDGDIDLKKFDDTDRILGHLKDLPANKRKTILSALVIITDDKKYRDLMLEDIKTYTQDIGKQEKTETQKDNWVGGAEVKGLWETLKRNADLLYKKTTLTQADLQQIQSYIILSLLGGMFIAPRRSKDYTDFKIKDIDRTKDNYLDKATLVFNSYKTAKCYGEQKVAIPPTLKLLLSKWIKRNPTPWLLFDTNGNQLSSVKLNQRLNKLFDGKKVGVNMLRHSYLTDKYADTISQNKSIQNDMTNMGSSTNMLKTYVKED
jgi:hypothetical protein